MDEKTTYGDWVDLMHNAYELFPQIKVYHHPFVFSTQKHEHCMHAVPLSSLTPIQRDALCYNMFSVGEDNTAEAFPEFHAWSLLQRAKETSPTELEHHGLFKATKEIRPANGFDALNSSIEDTP